MHFKALSQMIPFFISTFYLGKQKYSILWLFNLWNKEWSTMFHQIVVYYLKWYFNIYLVFISFYISNFLQVYSTYKRNIRWLITFITFPSFKRMCNLRLQTDFCTMICLLCVCKSDQRLWIVSHQHNFRLHLFTKRNSTLD